MIFVKEVALDSVEVRETDNGDDGATGRGRLQNCLCEVCVTVVQYDSRLRGAF